MQIYSVKVTAGASQRPLHVFGLVAVRDSIDSQRNLIFNIQERDDCQTLTEEVCIVFLLMLHPCLKAYKLSNLDNDCFVFLIMLPPCLKTLHKGQ